MIVLCSLVIVALNKQLCSASMVQYKLISTEHYHVEILRGCNLPPLIISFSLKNHFRFRLFLFSNLSAQYWYVMPVDQLQDHHFVIGLFSNPLKGWYQAVLAACTEHAVSRFSSPTTINLMALIHQPEAQRQHGFNYAKYALGRISPSCTNWLVSGWKQLRWAQNTQMTLAQWGLTLLYFKLISLGCAASADLKSFIGTL